MKLGKGGTMNVKLKSGVNLFYKRSGIYIAGLIIVCILIGLITTVKPAYRLSSGIITSWTSDINSATFLYLLGLENHAFQQAFTKDQSFPDFSSTIFQLATSVKPDDPRSLIGNELPGFSTFDNQILIAGEGTNYTNLPFESSPPLKEVLKDRQAVINDDEEKESQESVESKNEPTTGNKNVVFLYNSHNRESFLPHLPDVTDPNHAHHKEVNITKVSERLAKTLQTKGIGTAVDHTDIMAELNKKGWDYGKSYEASREVVSEAFSTNKDIQYAFDIHRDSIGREKTTKEISGQSYARIMIVVGAEHESYERNLELATELHYMIEERYPGLSRGVLPKKGELTNGIFNQDISNNALLLEFGGVENNLDELYRSADALAEVFSEMYWNAEEVNAAS
ncbi:stage II sporulation protein P [Virgibacillus kapii]|uniref:Stage II sporulation protein P n=2 Tax=Virgibacillus kapii TaxID=1638645 RepID=A0ABQ2D6W3_9BACI|nr:stage II sporulation protein P [Virgibacillus kapii]